MRGRWVNVVVMVGTIACLGIGGCGGGGSAIQPLVIMTTSLPDGTVGTPYIPQLLATGGTPAYTWSQTSGGAMPDGVTVNSSGQFSGTPTVPGTFGPYVFQVADSSSPALTATSVSMGITIQATSLTVTTSSLPNGTTGAAYTATLAAVGGAAPYTWAETSGGAMPPGISDITSGGVIAGTPTTPGTYGPYVFTVTDSKAGTAASASLTITISGMVATKCAPQGNEAALSSSTPYAFLVSGSDGNGKPIAIAGSFTPNGNGGLATASLDYNGFSSGPQQVQVDLTGSSYSFGSTANGCLSLAFQSSSSTAIVGVTGVNFSFDLAALDGSGVYHTGRIIESDNTGGTGINASGSMHVQTASDFALAALQPRYAFGTAGWKVAAGNSGLYRTTFAGSFGNSNGTLSSGFADLNEGGTPSGELTRGTGQLGSIDATTGRGTGSFVIPAGVGSTFTLNFTFYVINGSALSLLSSDSPVGVGSPALLYGQALVANASSSSGALDGYFLLATEGLNLTAGGARGKNTVEIATLSATSAGTIPLATFYLNDAGAFATVNHTNATYSVEAASGRTSITSSDSTALPVVYLTANTSLDDGVVGFVVGNDTTAQSGVLISQSTTTPNYTLSSVTGKYASGTAEDVDGANGAFLGAFTFDGIGGYTVVSQTTGSLTNTPSAGSITINADGSGSLDGGNFPFVTNGAVLFALPNTGDPLLYVLTSGTN